MLDHIRENILFDLRYGTNTSSWLQTNQFDQKPVNLKHGVRYRAAATSEIAEALNKAAQIIEPSQTSFYDLGCGKGKVLCVAALNHKFRRIAGVDYYQPFLDQVERNAQICGLEGVELHFEDMSDFKGYEERSVIFLYNPADAYILDKVRQNVEALTKKAVVIYNKPVHEEVFKDWTLVSKKKARDPDHCTSIFSFEAPA